MCLHTSFPQAAGVCFALCPGRQLWYHRLCVPPGPLTIGSNISTAQHIAHQVVEVLRGLRMFMTRCGCLPHIKEKQYPCWGDEVLAPWRTFTPYGGYPHGPGLDVIALAWVLNLLHGGKIRRLPHLINVPPIESAQAPLFCEQDLFTLQSQIVSASVASGG